MGNGSKIKVVTVVGARPQFIKAAVVSKAIARDGDLEEVIVHTGQHYDSRLSEIFFQELGIPAPRHNLHIGSGLHGAQTGAMLAGIEELLLVESPNWLLVYGDTNSTLAGALAAAKLHIPVAHVEAGLRSFNRRMPEEVNRILTDHVSELLFAPTEVAQQNLLSENLPARRIEVVGDVMYDATLYYARRGRAVLGDIPKGQPYVLMTIHRAENTDDLHSFDSIMNAMLRVAQSLPVVWPVHPRSLRVLREQRRYDRVAAGIRLLEPAGYLDMLQLEKHAAVIVTDSGGVQKEAFFQRRPCVTLRTETEWTELVDLGWNRLCIPGDEEQIVTNVLQAIGSKGRKGSPYGEGNAADRIVTALKAYAAII